MKSLCRSTFDEQTRRAAAELADQLWLCFMVPFGGRTILRPGEVAVCLGYKHVSSVYAEVEREGTWLEVLRRTGVERQELLITRRSVLLTLARWALEGNAKLPLFMERVKAMLTALGRTQLEELAAEIARLKGGRK